MLEFLSSLGDILIDKKDSKTADFFEHVKFGMKESNDETNQIIDELVNKKLIEYDLVP